MRGADIYDMATRVSNDLEEAPELAEALRSRLAATEQLVSALVQMSGKGGVPRGNSSSDHQRAQTEVRLILWVVMSSLNFLFLVHCFTFRSGSHANPAFRNNSAKRQVSFEPDISRVANRPYPKQDTSLQHRAHS